MEVGKVQRCILFEYAWVCHESLTRPILSDILEVAEVVCSPLLYQIFALFKVSLRHGHAGVVFFSFRYVGVFARLWRLLETDGTAERLGYEDVFIFRIGGGGRHGRFGSCRWVAESARRSEGSSE